jgi:malate dehydrogenase
VRIGPNGAEEIFPIGEITEYEQGWLVKMQDELKSSIKQGQDFVKNA